jgi:hypothetical protein
VSFLSPTHAAAQATNQAPASESSTADATSAQSAPDKTGQVPQPGQLGSPFSADHFWKHIALELSSGYSPVVSKGAGYFTKGFTVTAGVIDHLSPHWNLLAEAHFFGLEGASPYSNTDFALDLGGSYYLLSRSRTNPYLIGSVGYYELGTVTTPQIVQCVGVNCPGNILNAASAVGYNGGIGIRHKLYADRHMEIFAEGRYHYIASGSTDFGQISLIPISAGIRW